MSDEEVVQDLYRPGDLNKDDGGNKFIKWMTHNFQHGKAMVIISFIVVCGLAWWSKNWSAPIVYLIGYFVVLKIMRWFRKSGQTIVVESRLQGEIITHCDYFEKPIDVPNSAVRIHLLPESREKDVISYGDNTQAVKTNNIVFVDYFEPIPNNDIIMVYPKDANFGNFALYSRMNDDLAKAMAVIGERRMANRELKSAMVDAFHEGRFGDPDSVEAQNFIRVIMADTQNLESKLGNSEAAKRNIWLYYKDTIPHMHKQLLLMEQELPKLGMAEASKLVHAIFQHPMSAEIHEKVQAMLGEPSSYDYEERVQEMIKKGKMKSKATDADEDRRSVVTAGTTRAN